MSELIKHCVYDQQVSEELTKIGHALYDDIEALRTKYPDVNYKGMIFMALHRAASVATNSAEGEPINRMWLEVELEEKGKP